MSKRSVRAVVMVVVLVCGFAALAGAGDSIKVVGASPMSGVFPVSPASGTVTVAYELVSAPYGAINVGPYGVVYSYELSWHPQIETAWVSHGTGQVTLHYTITCGPDTPPCEVDGFSGTMEAAQTLNGPLGAQLAVAHLESRGILPCNPPPDITVPRHSGIQFGQKGVAWGSSASLAPADSTGCAERGCVFEAAYDIINAGGSTNASPFSSQLSVDTPMNVVAEASNLTLKKGGVKGVRTKLHLPPGTHTLLLVLDPTNKVAEANENNNRFQITYTLGKPSGPLAHR